MHICYLDDSGDTSVRAFSALCIPASKWHESFAAVKAFRRSIRDEHGIYTTKELHATQFVSGRGRIATKDISKGQRCAIYGDCLSMIASLPSVSLFNAIAPRKDEYMLFERLLNRINRTMEVRRSYVLLISDEGKDYNRLVRKMGVYNPIPSKFEGGETKNVVLKMVLDEIMYKRSQDSHFIQMADFCAYALLRSEILLESKVAYGLHKSFDKLAGVCLKQCYSKDPRGLGIIRV